MDHQRSKFGNEYCVPDLFEFAFLFKICRYSYSPVSMSSGRSGRPQGDLLKDMSRRRLLGRERQRQVTDDPVHASGAFEGR
jgi:hypothetical protein